MLSPTTPKPRSVVESVPAERWAIRKTAMERSAAATSEVDEVSCSTGPSAGLDDRAADRPEAALTAGRGPVVRPRLGT